MKHTPACAATMVKADSFPRWFLTPPLHSTVALCVLTAKRGLSQVASWCSEEATVLSGLRERYMELFGVLLSTSAEAQRLYCSMAAQKQQADKSLKAREKAVLHLQQQLLK